MILGLPLTLLLLLVLAVFYALDFAFMARYDRQRKQGKGWAWDYTLMTLAGAALVILQPWLLPRLGLRVESAWGLGMQAAGLACIVASFGLHIWARLHLRKFYAERVEVQPDHEIIQSGPYALIRHPIITSFFLLAFGIFLADPAVTTVLALLYAIWDFTRAARQEEELLAKNLAGYAVYMQRVPRFFPSIRRRKRDRA